MILYHGSNLEVKNPILIQNKRNLDFGQGFYLTSDFEQANKWAVRTTERRNSGFPTVSIFNINDDLWHNLNIKEFTSPNKEWLNYVTKCRKGQETIDEYDVIIGPVANDQTMPTIGIYLRGYITEEMAIELLLPQKLKDQYAFKTSKALACLSFKESICQKNG